MSNQWITVISKRERALQKRIQLRREQKREACKIALEEIGKALLAVSVLKKAVPEKIEKAVKKIRGGRRLHEKREKTVKLHNLLQNAFDNAMAFDVPVTPAVLTWDHLTFSHIF